MKSFLFVFYSADLGHLIAYVTYIDGIVVSTATCVAVLVVGVLPCLREPKIQILWKERVLLLSSGWDSPGVSLRSSRCSPCEETRWPHIEGSPFSRPVSVDSGRLWWRSESTDTSSTELRRCTVTFGLITPRIKSNSRISITDGVTLIFSRI